MSTGSARGETTIVQPSSAERAVARRAAESRATVPHLELSIPAPGELADAVLLKACALALAAHPRVNAAYRDGRFELYSRVNIGFVLALEEAYLMPTVFDADRRPVGELEEDVQALRRRAQERQLVPADFSGATFTLWNAAPLGLTQASVPVVPPQAAALSAGTAQLTLACDHRILYGATAISFLTDLRRQLDELLR